jgi:DHA1 family bicyclomycin/chloramphenicol resistance-like MFS transporter
MDKSLIFYHVSTKINDNGVFLLKAPEDIMENEDNTTKRIQMLRNFQSLLKDRQFLGCVLAQGVMIAGIFAYGPGTPFIYQNIYGASP